MKPPVKTRVWNEEVRVESDLLFRTMQITDAPRFEWDVAKALAGREKYHDIAERVHSAMPWWFVAVIHGMECSYSFEKHLHNGDSLRSRTRLVPSGRPAKGKPPFTFQESAIDALTMPGKQYHLATDWSIPRTLFRLEGFNGYGYRFLSKPIFSPYLWAGTNHYERGKYIRDHVYSDSAVSTQAGTAGMIKLLIEGGAR